MCIYIYLAYIYVTYINIYKQITNIGVFADFGKLQIKNLQCTEPCLFITARDYVITTPASQYFSIMLNSNP